MNNEKEIRTILLKILSTGLLRIRALGANGSSQQCFVEADHLHNVPAAVESLRPELIHYYYNAERLRFLSGGTVSGANDFKPLWDHLAELIKELQTPDSDTR